MTREAGEASRARRYEVWRTADVAEPRRFAYFREAVCEAFMDLSPEHDRSRPFDAVVESIPLADGAVNRVSGTPHHVRRTAGQIGRSSEQCFFLNLQLKSECAIEQQGRTVRLAPGQVALFGSDLPFRILHPPERDMSVASFWLPRDLVEESLPGRRIPDLSRVSDHPFLGPLIAATARVLNRGSRALDAADARLMLESLVRLSARSSARILAAGAAGGGLQRSAVLAPDFGILAAGAAGVLRCSSFGRGKHARLGDPERLSVAEATSRRKKALRADQQALCPQALRTDGRELLRRAALPPNVEVRCRSRSMRVLPSPSRTVALSDLVLVDADP